MEKVKTKREISCGAILYAGSGNRINVLLLEQDNAHYKRTGSEAKKAVIDIGPSGRKEKDENDEATARREIYEETGLKGLNFDKGFRFDLKYEFDATDDNGEDVHIMKTRRFWCARLPEGYENMIRISPEHKRYLLEPIGKAIKMKELEDSKKEALESLRAYITKVKRR
ncbi:MAG: NUDIX domain-containing protein [Candidatus Marsarchaeota archaeon]|jgi:8-oxo-dGTP pyrophosphatase MutT (NUDIX family)|nr:NUDIX domain-containing protein [Candidatus Marsarchaeota archaeon]